MNFDKDSLLDLIKNANEAIADFTIDFEMDTDGPGISGYIIKDIKKTVAKIVAEVELNGSYTLTTEEECDLSYIDAYAE